MLGRGGGRSFIPYVERSEIVSGALAGRGLALAWLADPVDGFFLEIQCAGGIRLETGEIMRVGYAGKNGRAYRAIGRDLIERGAVRREDMSMQAIRDWLSKTPDEAQAVMNLLMTSTPLAMLHAEHLFAVTALVNECHKFFMYAPGFFTGSLINRFGAVTMSCIGIAFQTISVAVALSVTEVFDFWLAMALLGIGWNYAFTAGTNLLTETYTPSERAKTQAANNFIIFSVVAGGSLSSGTLMHYFGWDWVNIGALPLLFVSFLAALWLWIRRRRDTPVTT